MSITSKIRLNFPAFLAADEPVIVLANGTWVDKTVQIPAPDLSGREGTHGPLMAFPGLAQYPGEPSWTNTLGHGEQGERSSPQWSCHISLDCLLSEYLNREKETTYVSNSVGEFLCYSSLTHTLPTSLLNK